jgi:hypothetical protein
MPVDGGQRSRQRGAATAVNSPGSAGQLDSCPASPGRSVITGGPALGVFLVGGLALVVEFEDIGENSETGLHLGRYQRYPADHAAASDRLPGSLEAITHSAADLGRVLNVIALRPGYRPAGALEVSGLAPRVG